MLILLFWCNLKSKKITQTGMLLESNKPVGFTVLSNQSATCDGTPK